MATEKILNTRIINKHAELLGEKGWEKSNLQLKEGEIALAKVTVAEQHAGGQISEVPAYLIKIGVEGKTFNETAWAYAKAADVYAWAKQANLPVECGDDATADGYVKGNVISSVYFENGKIKYTTATVATSEGLANLIARVETIEELLQIETKTIDGVETQVSVVITDFEERITANEQAIAALDLQINGKPAQGTPDTDDYVEAVLGLKDTKADKSYVDETFTTPSDVTSIVNKAIADVSDADTIDGITNLVEYVAEHGSDLTAIIKEVYGDSMTDIPADGISRIDTAVSDASEAKSIAEAASQKVNTDTESAKSYAQAAAGSAESAQTSANTATQKAADAAGSATSAASAQTAAENAKGAAETAQQAAEAAQEAAEGSASDAAASASAANASASSASTSAQTATEKASAASTSASNAAESAQTATNKASEAAQSAVDAGVSATNASDSANSASASAGAAADSASDAASSASSASESASTATTQAGIATEKAGLAATSATNASESATNAAESAGAAAESASDAAGSAQAAANSASDANASASAAAGSASDASASASAAASSAGDANAAKSAAETARDEAVAAKEAALASNTSATAIANEAKEDAENALEKSNSALQSVTANDVTPSTSVAYPAETTAVPSGIKVSDKGDGTTQNISIDDSITWIFDCGGAE